MKKRRYKIFGCLLLIGAIAASIGITSSFGNTKIVLTDNEMSSIVGGMACHYCGSNGNGCAPGGSAGNCSLPDCDGWVKTSCLQAQQHCVSDNTTSTCGNTTKPCTGGYFIYTCGKCFGEDANGDPIEWCEYRPSESKNCAGSRSGCL